MKPVILILEDDPELRFYLATMFMERDYHTVCVSYPSHALHILQNAEVALSIVDGKLPEMSGVEFIEKARAVGFLGKFIYCTTDAEIDTYPKIVYKLTRIHGVSKVLRKPFGINDMLFCVDRLLEDRGARGILLFSGKRASVRAPVVVEAAGELEVSSNFDTFDEQKEKGIDALLGSMPSPAVGVKGPFLSTLDKEPDGLDTRHERRFDSPERLVGVDFIEEFVNSNAEGVKRTAGGNIQFLCEGDVLDEASSIFREREGVGVEVSELIPALFPEESLSQALHALPVHKGVESNEVKDEPRALLSDSPKASELEGEDILLAGVSDVLDGAD